MLLAGEAFLRHGKEYLAGLRVGGAESGVVRVLVKSQHEFGVGRDGKRGDVH